jgi:hypothetical protein
VLPVFGLVIHSALSSSTTNRRAQPAVVRNRGIMIAYPGPSGQITGNTFPTFGSKDLKKKQ